MRDADRSVQPAPGASLAQRAETLKRVRWLSNLFDDRFRIPGTDRRFGLDGLLGLVPGVGDTATGAVSLYLVAEAWRLGMPFSRIMQMGFNVGVDMVVGSIPLVGDIFDFAWKANRKNVQIMLDHLERDPELASLLAEQEKKSV